MKQQYYIAARFLYVLSLALISTFATAKVFHDGNYDPQEFSDIESFQTQRDLTLADISSVPKSEWAKAPTGQYLNFGYTTNSIWIRFHIKNVSKIEHLILRIAYPPLDYLDLYQVSGEGHLLFKTEIGDRRPRSNKSINSNEPIIPLTVPTGSRHTIYIRLSGQGGTQAPLSLTSRDGMAEISARINWLNVQFGVAVAALLAMLVLWRVHGNRTYLYYGAFVGTTTLFVNAYYNVVTPDILFWAHNLAPTTALADILKDPDTHHSLIPILFAGASLSAAFLFRSIFMHASNSKTHSWVFSALVYSTLASIPLMLVLSYQHALYVMYGHVFALSVSAIASMGIRFAQHPSSLRTDGFFSLCLAIIMTSFVLNTLNEINWLGAGSTPLFANALLFGTFLQALLLGVATIIHLTKAEKEILQSRIQLDNSQKLSGLGELAGGVIHEIRNPMTPISVLVAKLPDVPSDRRGSFSIEGRKQVARIFSILDGLKDMSSTQPFTFDSNVNVRSIVDDALHELSDKLSNIHVDVSCSAHPINASSVHLCQALSNLISNAADALHGSDTLDKYISITVWHSAESIKIIVFNNGPSIPKAQQDKMFAPFFTTKSKGKGLGLGMSIVHQIVQRHAGTIEVNSEEGSGVEFHITLPLDPLGRTQL